MRLGRWPWRLLKLCTRGLIVWGLFAGLLAHAQEGIEVQNNTHSFVFGQQVRFALQVTSANPIQSIVLAYRTSDTQGTTVETMAFEPSTSVSVEHVHEIGRRYIRPFVEVTYWWTVNDAQGNQIVTEPQTFAYADDRFEWRTEVQDGVKLYWYRGDPGVAQQALEVAVAGLDRARQDVGVVDLRTPIQIYLYSSAEDLHLALPAGLPSGAQALTLYETNVILVSLGPETTNIPGLRRILPHEVTHALIHEATQNRFDRVPFWLSEGLATSVEYVFSPDPDAAVELEAALRGQNWISLDTLCAAFPQDPASARLAYVQSASLVNHVRDVYGRQALRDLIAAYADGATCEGGVRRVMGFSLQRLQTLWLASLAPQGAFSAFWKESGAWVFLFILFALLPLLFVRTPRSLIPGRRKKVW
jgi:hypothetical protein